MTKKRLIITSIIVLIVLACGSFYGGMIYGKSQSAASSASAAGSFLGLRGGRGGSTTISGNIISGDSESIVLALPQGGSDIVFYSSATKINKSSQGTPDDLTVGEQVSVMGTPGSNGSINAQSIQIRSVGQAKPGSQTIGQ
jgi:hypothetical protein